MLAWRGQWKEPQRAVGTSLVTVGRKEGACLAQALLSSGAGEDEEGLPFFS